MTRLEWLVSIGVGIPVLYGVGAEHTMGAFYLWWGFLVWNVVRL